MRKATIIVAMDAENGIGKNNDLMWDLPNDMRFFKEKTSGSVVIMGRKNYDSIPEKYRPLSNRTNVILSRDNNLKVDGCLVFNNLKDCLAHFQNTDEKLFIIGGGEIYRLALQEKCIDEMYISHVASTFSADVFFPEFNPMEWKTKVILTQEIDNKHAHSFITKQYMLISDHNQ